MIFGNLKNRNLVIAHGWSKTRDFTDISSEALSLVEFLTDTIYNFLTDTIYNYLVVLQILTAI